MVCARQYDTRLNVRSGAMTPEGEIAAQGRIFLGDPETQVIYRIEPFAKITRQQYLARHGTLPDIPQRALDVLRQMLDQASGNVALHEAGHIVVSLHHRSRVLS